MFNNRNLDEMSLKVHDPTINIIINMLPPELLVLCPPVGIVLSYLRGHRHVCRLRVRHRRQLITVLLRHSQLIIHSRHFLHHKTHVYSTTLVLKYAH